MLFLPAFGYLFLMASRGAGSFANGSVSTTLLLAGAGIVTSVPLLLFASGARRITLTSLGLLQYIAPTLQFLIGVLVYGEEFGPARIVGFGLIWLALALYSFESISHRRRSKINEAPQPVS